MLKQGTYKKLIAFCMATVLIISTAAVGKPTIKNAQAAGPADIGEVYDGVDLSNGTWAGSSRQSSYYFGQNEGSPNLWRLLEASNSSGYKTGLLLSESSIGMGYFRCASNWEYATIRTYLNGVFLEGLPQEIKESLLNDTKDAVSLLSKDKAEELSSADRAGIGAWWLKTANNNSAWDVQYVDNDGTFKSSNAESKKGIRPALTLDKSKVSGFSFAGEGTEEEPYTIDPAGGTSGEQIIKDDYIQFSLLLDGADSDVQWKVIGESNSDITILSHSSIETKSFNNDSSSWVNSDIRRYLDLETGNENSLSVTPQEKNRMKISEPDGEEGTQELLYLLSKEEAENTNYFADDSDRSIGSTWWLRTARSGNLYSAYYVGKNGSTTGSDNAVSVSKHGIRPAFKLDLESIIFASEVRRNVDVDKTPWLTLADDNYSAASESSAQNMKLTFLNENMNLTEVAYDTTSLAGDGSDSITANAGEVLRLSGKGSASGAGMTINYKIVKSNKTQRDIVGYGIGTSDVTGNNDSININTIDLDGEALAAGEYTVYMWLQKNNDASSHEGSKPSYFTLTIENTGVTNTIQVNDGVDQDDLLNLGNGNNGIYFGTYQHAAKLKSQSYGEVRTRDNERKPILWNIRGKQVANYEVASGHTIQKSDSPNPDQIALLSNYILDSKQYNKERAAGAERWETSPIRTWLNGEFLTDNFKSFEQEAVTETKNLRTTNIKGEGVSYTDDQIYLLNEDPNNKNELDNILSQSEKKSTLNNGTGVPGINWWTRSSGIASYGNGVDVVQYNGSTKIKWTTDYHGIRPAFKLDPESIIFASEVVKDAKEEEPWYTPEDSYYKEAGASGKNSKLTLFNRKLSLSTLTHGTNSIANNGSSEILVRPGKSITLRGQGNIAEGDMSIRYKIVKSNGSKREIVGYGIGTAEVTNNDMCDITIPAMNFSGTGLDDGSYTVHVWLQRSNAINSNEGSMPKQFTMLVQTEDINVIGTANDGVDFDDLLDTKKGRFVYYGNYDHAAASLITGEGDTVVKEGFDKPVLWRVQGKQTADPNETKEHISLLSEYVLDYKPYNDSSESMDPSQRWETSGIRTWLNFDFINENFKEDSEQVAMVETKDLKTTNDQSEFLQSTNDKMYLLTYDTKNENNFETFHSLEESDKTATLRTDSINATWWLRSPSSDSGNRAVYVDSNGSANHNEQVHEYGGIRPGFKLNSEAIIFASEIKNGVNTMETPWYTLATLNKCKAATGPSAKNYKLTVVNEKLELKLSKEGADFQSDTATELVAEPGGEIKLTGEGYYEGGAVDIGCMIYYKIVKNNKSSKREIVSYGIGQMEGSGEITIPVKDFDGKDLADGEYTVYAWLQRNDDWNSNEGSQPLYFTLIVMEESAVNVGVDEYMNLTGAGNRWIYFGQYEHVLEASETDYSYSVVNQEEEATPMKWLMLGKSPVVYEDQDDVTFDSSALAKQYILISQYCLNTMNFGQFSGYDGDMWEDSIPRTWLNGSFREDNFEEAEKKEMVQSENMRTDASGDDANDGRTTDWFYLMNDTGASTWSLANVKNDKRQSYFYNGNPNIAIEPANGTSTKDKIINVGATWKFGDVCNWWLRSNAYYTYGRRYTRWQMFVDTNGGLVWDAGVNHSSTYKTKSKAIRPVFNLNPDNIVFASEVLDDVTGKSWATQSYANANSDWVYEEEDSAGKAFKLTVLGTESVNENGGTGLELVDLKSNGEAFNKMVVKTGDSFKITGVPYQYKDDNLEDYSIHYKIVKTDESDTSNHRIIAAGVGQANLINGNNEITITAKDFDGKTLNGGYYTVYVWLQKNNDTNSNEASVPQPFLLKVDTAAPSVIEITPKNGDIGVAKDGTIDFTFNTPIGSVGTVVLKNEITSEQIELDTAVLASDDGKTYTVSYSGLDSSTKYTIIIAGFKNNLGLPMMKDSSNSFTTIYEAGVSKDTMELLRKGNNEASDSFTIYLGDATSATIQSSDAEYVTVSSESIAASGGGAQEITVTGKKSTSSVAGNTVVITVRIYGAGAPVVRSIAVTVKQEYEITTQYVRGNELIGAGETRTVGDAYMDYEHPILTEEDKTELIENSGLIPIAYVLKMEKDIKNLSDEEIIAALEDNWIQWDNTATIKMSDYLDNITIYIKCLTTQIDIEIPVEMEFKANYGDGVNEKGKVSSDEYVMVNNSDLPVRVYLKQLSSSDQMDGIKLVENVINDNSSNRMHLALKGTSTTSGGFHQTIDNIVPDDNGMEQKLLGTLEGINASDLNSKTGSFTIGGQYEGVFPILIPKRPRVIFEFHFAISDMN